MITSWEYLESCRLPVILYGMGDGGDKVLNEAERRGINIRDVIASDGFVRGQSFRGFQVKTLAQAEQLYGEFVIVLGFASSRNEVISNIRAISGKHKLLAPSLPVFGENVFDLEFAKAHSQEIYRAYSLLADERSREIYALIIEFLLTGELAPLFKAETEKSEAFENILKLSQNESYFDLGAYRGDTVEEFLRFSGGSYQSITAFEPDIKNFRKLSAYAADFENIRLFQKGIWSADGFMSFSSRAGRNSALGADGAQVAVTSIDSVSGQTGIIPTYIKADVEGAEYEMLCGASETISLYKPKLNIALYHRAEDIFSLILKVHELNPNYKLHIRHHPYIPFWDTNLYAV